MFSLAHVVPAVPYHAHGVDFLGAIVLVAAAALALYAWTRA